MDNFSAQIVLSLLLGYYLSACPAARQIHCDDDLQQEQKDEESSLAETGRPHPSLLATGHHRAWEEKTGMPPAWNEYITRDKSRFGMNLKSVSLKCAPEHHLGLKSRTLASQHTHRIMEKSIASEVAIMRLGSPRLDYAYAYGTSGPKYYMLTRWTSGSLADMGTVQKHKGLEIVMLARDMMSGLAFLHSKDVIHGDIRPENVRYSCPSHAKYCRAILSDFTSSCSLSAREETRGPYLRLCRNDVPPNGAQNYMSREMLAEYGKSMQRREFRGLLKSGDVVAAGFTIHEVLDGKWAVVTGPSKLSPMMEELRSLAKDMTSSASSERRPDAQGALNKMNAMLQKYDASLMPEDINALDASDMMNMLPGLSCGATQLNLAQHSSLPSDAGQVNGALIFPA